MIQLERVSLPDGLRALAYRDPHGNLIIYVSTALDAACQRSAVVAAVRASRRTAGWRAGLPTAGIALLVGARTLLRGVVHAVRLRPVAWSAAATAAVAGACTAGVLLTTVPHRPGPSAAGPAPPSQGTAPARAHPSGPTAHKTRVRTRDSASPAPEPEQPASVGKARPAPTSTPGSAPAPAPTPAPTSVSQPSPAPTEPAPSPSPSPLICVIVAGIRVCALPVTISP
jgi:hypothetical protein